MPQLIKDGAIATDDWQQQQADAVALPAGKLLVPVSMWVARRDALLQRDPIGVWLDSDEDPACIGQDLHHFGLVAIHFPVFSDGRGYSHARMLREHYLYQGELRAVGDVLIDQIFYMKRCGFDSFALRDDQNADTAIASLSTFSETYQAAVDQPVPLFRRR